MDNGPFKDGESPPPIDSEFLNSDNIGIESEGGLVVWLKRDTGAGRDQARNVFSVDRVEADTLDDINRFTVALEELEATRARQILDSWQGAGWAIDRLQQLSHRQVMVIDSLLESWSDGNVINSVQLERAFEDQDNNVIVATVGRQMRTRLPDADCVEYIADYVGPYEFVDIEGSCIARDVWNVFRDRLEIMDCTIWGLVKVGHIQQRPDWQGWGSHYPFGFLKTAPGTPDA